MEYSSYSFYVLGEKNEKVYFCYYALRSIYIAECLFRGKDI